MSKKNKEAASIVRKESESSKHRTIALEIPQKGGGRVSPDDIYENVTKTKFCIKNYRFPDADILYPLEPGMRTVGKYFPIAECGPLYIDEPMRDDEKKECEKKRKHFEDRKLKYLVIDGNTDMISVMEQLGMK